MPEPRHHAAPGAPAAPGPAAARALIERLRLQPHPEGGWYREVFRSPRTVATPHGPRAALTTIDFLLVGAHAGRPCEFSAWHRVRHDEVWHLLSAADGGPLALWWFAPELDAFGCHRLGAGAGDDPPRAVIPAGAWQAAEPLGAFAHAGATVAPGFDFADFAFGRDDAAFRAALARLAPDLQRLL